MTYKKIGKYGGKIISFKDVNSLEEIGINNISCSAVLLWIGNEEWKKVHFVPVIEILLKKEVIAICVAGKRVEEQFELLLKTQSRISTTKHTMTYIFDEKKPEEVLENLFWVVITDGERWDNWRDYIIIVVGAPDIANDIQKLVTERWND